MKTRDQVVSDMIAQQITVGGGCHVAEKSVANEAGNCQSHEEMAEIEQVFEVDCQCDEEYRISGITHEGGQIE